MKSKIRKDIELMAPAGSHESLIAAIQGGADSIYFGIGKMNMRANSSHNFTLQDLEKIAAICRENKKKSYLAINTVIYDHEISMMKEIVDTARAHGISAIIATDQSVIHYAREKGMEVHLSTQLNISNMESLNFYAGFADVVVLARELSLGQVKNICQAIKKRDVKGPSGKLIRVEMFIHGALCMSISGKCYLSLHENNFSANKGACLQTCRKAYLVTEKESKNQLEIDNEYIMSPKDLCTIHFLNKILDTGVSVLKIEGRARPPEYVKSVTRCYNQALEAYFNNSYTSEKIENWKEQLSTVFNRGFWDGYYLGQKLGEWSAVYGSKATKRKIYLAKGTNYFSNLKVAEFQLETGTLQVDDEIIITGPTTGVIETRVKEIRVDDKPVQHASKGVRFSINIGEKVRRSDKLYKVVDAKHVKQQ